MSHVVYDGSLIPLGYEQITDLSAAVGLTVPDGAMLAIIKPESQNVRYRDDDTDPTATVGFPLLVDEAFPYNGQLHRIKFIEVTASAILNVVYYRF